MATISERFINELGNPIALHVSELPDAYPRADGIQIEMSSRNSETDWTMTRGEARHLWRALGVILEGSGG